MRSEEGTTPPRWSPPTRTMMYYVQSPSHHQDAENENENENEKMSLHDSSSYYYYCGSNNSNSSPTTEYHYHCESRFSKSNHHHHHHHRHHRAHWQRIPPLNFDDDEDDLDDNKSFGANTTVTTTRTTSTSNAPPPEAVNNKLFYVGCFIVCFLILFTTFSFILWASTKSKSYRPHILVKDMVFLDFTIQAGIDSTGVATNLLSLNSTVTIRYANPAPFFGLHVTSSPLLLFYYDLNVASGQMNKFYQKKKSHLSMTAVVGGHQIPLYGGMSALSNTREGINVHEERVNVELNLTFTMRSRAYVLGRLVKSTFYRHIRCPVTLDKTRLGKPINLIHSCFYR